MANESEAKSVGYVAQSGSFALSENFRRVVDSISSSSLSSPSSTSAAAQAFDRQLENYVRAQG